MTDRASLEALAQLYGVESSYYDALGKLRRGSDEAVLAVLRALGAEVQTLLDVEPAIAARRLARWAHAIEPVSVVWGESAPVVALRARAGEAERVSVRIALESGQARSIELDASALDVVRTEQIAGVHYEERIVTLGDALPFGYHQLVLVHAGEEHRALLISAPERAFVPEKLRAWGVFAPLYALHSKSGMGAGNATDLAKLVEWIDSLGGQVVGTLPLLATFLDQPFEPSPYSPVSKLFWNELFIDPARCVELARSSEARAILASDAFERERRELESEPLVDYARQYALLRPVLEALAKTHYEEGETDEMGRFLTEHPRARAYARFRAATEARGTSFHDWEPRSRDGQLDDGDVEQHRVRYHLFCQLRANEQILAACENARRLGLGLYLDMPLGVHPDGFDAWRERDAFLQGVSAGAPPDALFTGGQEWGFRPPDPEGLRRTSYQYVIDCLRHQMRGAGVLRIDHVMGLHRLYCVPEGMSATEGVYVHLPHEELYAIITLESVRHRTMIVGEDLGTVPDAVRAAMDRHALHRMYVLPFELRPTQPMIMGEIPESSVASANTHDLPTFQGFWSGADVDVRREMGLLDEGEATREHAARRRLVETLAERLGKPPEPAVVLRACLEAIAASPSRLLLVTLEDLWLEREPQNVPGTHRERPNWRRKLGLSLEQMREQSFVVETLRSIDMRRRGDRV